MRTTAYFTLALLCLTQSALGDDWPQFRGPGGAAISNATNLPSEWGADKNVAWKVRVPGYGWSSPIVWGDRIFVTSAVSEKQKPPQRKGPGSGAPPPDAVFRWEINCLDRATGKTLWTQVAAERKPTIGNHVSNTYATETPVTDGTRVYVSFGMVGLFCYDFAGKPIWDKN